MLSLEELQQHCGGCIGPALKWRDQLDPAEIAEESPPQKSRISWSVTSLCTFLLPTFNEEITIARDCVG